MYPLNKVEFSFSYISVAMLHWSPTRGTFNEIGMSGKVTTTTSIYLPIYMSTYRKGTPRLSGRRLNHGHAYSRFADTRGDS